jgi:Rrf2 family nitric oxide-sensitive transcriptional repressor
MRLTSFTDYTLRVLIYLGAHLDDERRRTISDIASAYDISENHLMKVVHNLARRGYIETTRGNGGGMRLARAPGQINIGEVVRDIEEDFALVECLQKNNVQCRIMPICTLSTLLVDATDAFLNVLDSRTLADILQPQAEIVKIFRNAHPKRQSLAQR